MSDQPWSPTNPAGIEIGAIPSGGFIARTGHAALGTARWAWGATPQDARKNLEKYTLDSPYKAA
jgi:hypothetical protein